MRHALPRGVRSAVRELCGDSAVALELTREFAGSLRFERTVADKLIGAAQRSEERWGTRCLAAGFLNESVLALDSAIGEEFRWLCSRLKMHDPEEGWRLEGILPALESAHALVEAFKIAPTLGKDQVIVVNLSGRGDKDCQEVARLLELRKK